ncbi:hypothetical protein IP70_10830 [alpha proteobacterium AAP38]|uniref:hypothetical protein n=1 Tax=Niveispirillum sp. TaxID=1917217 RepID=UPI0006B882E9|nr:hypothetical protein IP70_10830 [alpha proteobacterium AAP38]
MSSAKAVKQPVNLPETIGSKEIIAPVQTERDKLQARMDEEMERYNRWSAQGISVADEYGQH